MTDYVNFISTQMNCMNTFVIFNELELKIPRTYFICFFEKLNIKLHICHINEIIDQDILSI